MNSILRFIAIFTIVMAALKGMITIFTAGFGGMLSGGVKTATGSSYGLGQALGGVIAIFGGLIGISLILSVTMTLLNALYGIAYDLLASNEIVDAILEPIEDAVGDIPFLGSIIMGICSGIVTFLLTLIFSLTFPKLGGIPINVFCQYMADLPGKIAERAQMIEGTLLSGRSPAGGGPGRPGGGQGAYGRMASAQASQAFGSAQRQAVGVMSGMLGASAALAGMGLSAAGRALNKKGDNVEGRPSNPGLDNWDELSPEEQSAAAAAASDMGDDWEDMDQDARERAMEDRMAAEEARAQEGTDGQPDGNPPDGEYDPAVENDMDVSPESINMEDGTSVEDGMPTPDIVDGEQASISEAAGGMGEGSPDAGGAAGDQPPAGENAETDGLSLNEGANGDDNIANYNNEQQSIHAEQNIGNDIKADVDTKNVENTSLTEEGDKDFDAQADKDKNAVPQAGASLNEKAGPGKGTGGEGMAVSMSASTQNSQTANMNNNPTANIQSSQVDRSRSTINKGGDSTGNQTGTGQKPGAQNTGQGGTAGLNGTSQSAWGKEMSIKEQRKARVLHAVGDGLQMAGGNRTVGSGLKDAMGHMKDTAVAYTVSDDVMPTLTNSIRQTRRQREERLRRNRQNNGVN